MSGAALASSASNLSAKATPSGQPSSVPTPPPSFNCGSYGSSLVVTSPTPAAGPPGTEVSLEGSGYYTQSVPGSFTIWMANYTGGALIYLTTIPAGTPEPFTVQVTVPLSYEGLALPPGPYEFWSLNDSTINPGCANYPFTVTGSSPPVLSLDVPLGDPGSLVVASGTSFGVDTTVRFTFDGRSVTSTCSTDGNGNFPGTTGSPCAFTVPSVPNGDDGGQNVVAIDGASNHAAATYTVTPQITLSPTEGSIGATFTVTGSGFSPYPSGAVVDFDGQLITPTGGSDCSYDQNPLITLDSAGEFVCTYSVPGWATPGSNPVQGDDTNSSELTLVQLFTVPGQGGSGGSCPIGASGWGAIGSDFTSLPFWLQLAIVALVMAVLIALGYLAGSASAAGAAASAAGTASALAGAATGQGGSANSLAGNATSQNGSGGGSANSSAANSTSGGSGSGGAGR